MNPFYRIAPIALLSLAVYLPGCGSDDEVAPPSTELPDVDAGGDVSVPDATPDAEADTAVPDTSTPDVPDATADVEPADTSLDTAPDAAEDAVSDVAPDVDPTECEDPSGCWACRPTNELQFLNACTTVTGVRFDNAARLPLLRADGSLPPLP